MSSVIVGGDAVDHAGAIGARLRSAIETHVRGKSDVVEMSVICLAAEGHLLIDDFPGVGKTTLARALANALGLAWSRIQFTPDLLPSDLTGVSVLRQDRDAFEFRPGPVFNPIVIADEVNRAGPRTQAALLEAMEERTVSVDGITHQLPRPFIVIATQNPVDMAGTYPLPEAQLDRFLIRTSLGYPDLETEVMVVTDHHRGSRVSDLAPVVSHDEVLVLIGAAAAVQVDSSIVDYLVAITSWTRDAEGVALGASPRGSVGMLRASRARALIRGRDHITPEDIQALAEPVLAHRIVLDVEGQAKGLTQADVIARAVESVPAPQPA
jgi:MoxR-like ATPase